MHDHGRRLGDHRSVRQAQRRHLGHWIDGQILGRPMLAPAGEDDLAPVGQAQFLEHRLHAEGAAVRRPVERVHRASPVGSVAEPAYTVARLRTSPGSVGEVMPRPALVAAMLACLFAGPAASAPRQPMTAGIVGSDDRRPLPEAEPTLAAIGRVNREGGGFCTGTLIAPDRVLTAAHCLWDARRQRLLPAGRLHFVAGWRRGTHAGHARATGLQHDPDLRLDASVACRWSR